MDVTLQRHCARYIYVVPEGLRELLGDISREVLRSQPEDAYTFIADYLDALLITRENARVSAKFVQQLTEAAETIVGFLSQTGMSREKADEAAVIIQEAFRAWSERRGILKEDDEAVVARIVEELEISDGQIRDAALVIQTAFRTFKQRQQKEAQLLSGIVDWRVAARSAIKLYRRTGVSPEEAKRAANLIKAAYKGYYTRRAVRLLNEEQATLPEEELEETSRGASSSIVSETTGERKSKGVRIDFATLVPHVEFGDEELISKELESMAEEPEAPPADANVLEKIFGEGTKEQQTEWEFIRQVLGEIVAEVVDVDEAVGWAPIQQTEVDSEADVSFDEAEQSQIQKSEILKDVSEEELESELQEAKREMIELQEASGMKNKSGEEDGNVVVVPETKESGGEEMEAGSGAAAQTGPEEAVVEGSEEQA